MEAQAQYGPPDPQVEAWVERGHGGSLLTGRGGKPDVAHWDGSRDVDADITWIREYAAGKQEFQDKWITQARTCLDTGDHAQAIVASRLALEVPYQGNTWMFRSGPLEAMDLDDPIDDIERGGLSRKEMAEKLGESLSVQLKAKEMAFDLPYETKKELEGIASKSRIGITGNVVDTWSQAIRGFIDQGETHAAAVATIELAGVHNVAGQSEEALAAYRSAVSLLKQSSEMIDQRGTLIHDTAEMQEICQQAGPTLVSIIQLYEARGSLDKADKEVVRSTINDLLEVSGEAKLMQDMYDNDGIAMVDFGMYDRGEITDALFDGYSLLAASSRFTERRICKRALRTITERRQDSRMTSDGGSGWLSPHSGDPLPVFAE